MNRLIWAAAVAALLSACSSTKLDNVPVEDKSGTSVTQAAVDPNAGTGVGSRNVTGVSTSEASSVAAMMATNRVVYFDYDSYVIKPEFQSVI